MLFKFGLNRFLPVWLFFLSGMLLSFVDGVFFVQQQHVDVIKVQRKVEPKRTLCLMTLKINNQYQTRETTDQVCRTIHPGKNALLSRTQLLDKWVSLEVDNMLDITEPFERNRGLEWRSFILLLTWPLLSRLSLHKDLTYFYYAGIAFLFYHTCTLWRLALASI